VIYKRSRPRSPAVIGLTVTFVACFMFALSARATDLPAIGGSGGNAFYQLCPEGSFLSGFYGRAGDFVDTLSFWCSRWNPDTRQLEKAVPQRYPNIIGVSGGGEDQSRKCPDGFVIRGAELVTLTSANQLLDRFEFECTSFTDPKPGGPRIAFTSGDDRGGPSSGWLFCPDGELATGLHGRSGLFIDRVGLVCDVTPQEKFRRLLRRALLFSVAALGVLYLFLRRRSP
jgi:hypothetical protein